jgi:hypothetical protein
MLTRYSSLILCYFSPVDGGDGAIGGGFPLIGGVGGVENNGSDGVIPTI